MPTLGRASTHAALCVTAEFVRWLEHDPAEILSTVQDCIAGAISAAEKDAGSISVLAIGITNQRETTVVWDPKSGKPLHNAIAWPDTRTAAICRRFAKDLDGLVS